MRVFVTGGTGAIGGYAVPVLIGAGHDVSALAHSDAKADLLRGQGATPVRVSLFDRHALSAAFANHDAVVNLASALPSTTAFIRRSAWRECDRVRTQGSAAVVDAAIHASVPRLIQESVVMIYTDCGHNWIDEDHPVDHYPITRGNHAAEANAHRFTDTGRCAVTLRFGVFYGHGAAYSEQILDLARHHIGLAPGHRDSFISSIHLTDAADAVGTTLWISPPGRLAHLLGDRLTSLTRSLRVSNAKFQRATAWRPRFPSVRQGYHAMAAPTVNTALGD